MISPALVKIIAHLPKGLLRCLSNKLLNGYIKKYANIKVSGKEKLSDFPSPTLYICNHLSNSDALVLNKVMKEKDLTFVAGVKLSNTPLTNLGVNITKTIPIKPNSADKDAISKIIKTLKEGKNILIFPEGTRSRSASLIEAKRGVFLIAKLSKADIVPVAVTGTENLLPINKSDMGAEKFNYADVTVTIGDKIGIPEREPKEEKHTYENRCVTYFMKQIANLLPDKYKGVYK
ncbi:lysophospholipid acyltransferase family protein [Clostridium sp. JN-9]|mgnify:FL=1|uniref:lysophospholipid acyltransferase family protein n=1 Tax=Clostridium sp. JN-9 TaxID=2507159 RepID=UPI000FFE186C|nr:lysophospholipid acyltransferase family protein [Clostridium sp. JN-9]QAT39039.1 1-acyl-sn-glycerol-3-phosphate acyltransferase [Clostridium sp. JN-9]